MNSTPESFVAFVGLDWADRAHHVCLRAAGAARDEHSELLQQPEALHAWAEGLRQRFPQGRIAVALEQSRGPVVYALQAHLHLAVHPVNPAMLAKYRSAAQSANGAKSDPRDGGLLCELLRVHPDWLRALPAPGPELVELQLLLEHRRGLVGQRTALVQQLAAALKAYFPQALRWAGALDRPMAWAFLRRWSSLAKVQAARPATVERFYHAHGARQAELITARLAEIRTAVALTDAPAVLAAYPLQVAAILAELAALHEPLAEYDRRIAALFARQADAALFAGVPGAGPQLAPRLLVAFGEDRARYPDAQTLQRYSGVAPVRQQSGRSCTVQWRWHCPTFLRQSFHEQAGCSIPHSQWAKAYYQLQLERGKTAPQAIRALAFKWQRILFRCWQDRRPYDEERYLAALRKKGSPLIARLDALASAA